MPDAPSPKRKLPFVTKLEDESSVEKLLAHLYDEGFEVNTPQHTRFQAKKKGVSVTLYESGKLMVQGKDAPDFIEYYLEPEILHDFSFSYRELNLDLSPRIGVDESGKGDFFGPLCVAGVYAEGDSVKRLLEIGCQDSKTLKDPAILKMAGAIRKEFKHHIIRINPPKYNELYGKFGNLNTLLGWCHATVLEQLSAKTGSPNAIIDQFASEHLVANMVKRKGLNINLTQRTKGEEDVVVAAASILARAAFVEGLANLEKSFNMPLPKGASVQVLKAGKRFVETFGEKQLDKVGKMHFKTANKILGVEIDE